MNDNRAAALVCADLREIQAVVLTLAGSVCAARFAARRQMESATTHGAPESATLIALPAQLK